MRDLAVITFLTLDGVMQAPGQPEEDLSGDFKHGGWAAKYFDEVMGQVNEVPMAAPVDLVFGRKTYELFAAHWPTVSDDNPHAKTHKAGKIQKEEATRMLAVSSQQLTKSRSSTKLFQANSLLRAGG